MRRRMLNASRASRQPHDRAGVLVMDLGTEAIGTAPNDGPRWTETRRPWHWKRRTWAHQRSGRHRGVRRWPVRPRQPRPWLLAACHPRCTHYRRGHRLPRQPLAARQEEDAGHLRPGTVAPHPLHAVDHARVERADRGRCADRYCAGPPSRLHVEEAPPQRRRRRAVPPHVGPCPHVAPQVQLLRRRLRSRLTPVLGLRAVTTAWT